MCTKTADDDIKHTYMQTVSPPHKYTKPNSSKQTVMTGLFLHTRLPPLSPHLTPSHHPLLRPSPHLPTSPRKQADISLPPHNRARNWNTCALVPIAFDTLRSPIRLSSRFGGRLNSRLGGLIGDLIGGWLGIRLGVDGCGGG